MVENCLNKSLGFGARVQNLLSDLETRLPKLPMANDSRDRLPPQTSCREGRECRGAGPERTFGIANENSRDRCRAPRKEAGGCRSARSLSRLPSTAGRGHQARRRAGAPVRTPERDEEKWKPVFRPYPALNFWTRSRCLRSCCGVAHGVEQNPGQPGGEGIGRLFPFHHPSLVEEEPNNILEFFLIRSANFRGQGPKSADGRD